MWLHARRHTRVQPLLHDNVPRVTDPLDWIEQIPFGETRNYVQRVLENTEVYRARLAGKDVPLRILPDLYAPNPPTMTVLSGMAAPESDGTARGSVAARMAANRIGRCMVNSFRVARPMATADGYRNERGDWMQRTEKFS